MLEVLLGKSAWRDIALRSGGESVDEVGQKKRCDRRGGGGGGGVGQQP